jgi:hypothetical protein
VLAVAFDTLKLAQRLESGGMPAKQAQDMSAALAETLTEWHSVGNLATKDDIQKLDTKIEATKTELLKWLFISVGSQTLVLLVALFVLTHGGKP